MITTYLKIALRNLHRQKGYSFINIFGLALGMAICLMMLLFIQQERSYDGFHENADRLYRVMIGSEGGGTTSIGNRIPEPVVAMMHESLPEVEAFVKTSGVYGDVLITANGQPRYEDRFMQAGSSFFDLFTHESITGNLDSALDEPGSIVLTESAARTYFGDEDPMGKIVTITSQEGVDHVVTAVIKDVPANTHIKFDVVAHRADRDQPRWNYYMTTGYVLLREGTNLAGLEAKLPAFVQQNAYYDHQRENLPWLLLQPVTDIHLYPDWGQENAGLGPVLYLYLFGAVALLILLIACVNFMNLSTARSATRAREVGVRKTVGARRSQLISQFLSESVLTSVLALVLALVLAYFLLPAFNVVMGADLEIRYGSEPILLMLVGIAILSGLLSGSYPAFFLSSFRPTHVLKGASAAQVSSGGFRKALVVFQFCASVVLILATIIIYSQMEFIRETRLDANDDEVLVLRQGDVVEDSFEAFKRELLAKPHVASVAAGPVLGSRSGTLPLTDAEGTVHTIDYVGIGDDYLETLGLELIAGREFTATDYAGGMVVGGTTVEHRRPVIINETAISVLGLTDPVGDFVQEINGTVLGVVQDYHLLPMSEAINPLVMQFEPGSTYTMLVRLEAGHIAEGLASVQQVWSAFVPDRPLNYAFLDDELDKAYRAELRLGNLFGGFAVLAVVIACLGLYGLAAFTAEQRTKEIGIRKVLGASVGHLVALLSADFLKLVGIAFILAAPVAWFVMNRWLENFAYHIDLTVWVFLLAGLAALLIALVTVSHQGIRAAVADPVKSLRYE